MENLINEWLGFESGASLYGSNQDNVVNLSADVEKRDATIKAFKVRMCDVTRGILLITNKNTARMAGLW